VKRAEELPADLRRAKGNPRPEGIVRQFAEEKSATPGQVALACNRSINCGRICELIAARRARRTPYILDAAKRLSDAALGNFSRDAVE
jgi:hypothetical protein